MTDEEVLKIASDVGWNVEHRATNDYLIKFARALVLRAALAEPQTIYWEECEQAHPECKEKNT